MTTYNEYHLPLNPGDLLAVAYGNKLYKYVFVRYGKKGNIQMLSVWGDSAYYLEKLRELKETGTLKQKGYVTAINTHADRRVVRITSEELTQGELKSYNIIKEYITKVYSNDTGK